MADEPCPWPLVAPYARQDAVLTLLVHEAQRRLQGERDNGMVPFPATTGQPRVVVSRKMQAPSGFETAFAGRHVVFTGEMEAIERNVAEALVQAEGGTTSAAISGKTDLVVVGEKPGPSKLTKAKQLGLQVLGEDEFLAMAGKTSVTAEAIAWLDEFVPAGWSPIPTPAGLPHSKSEVLAFKPTGQDSWEFLLLAGVFASEWEGLQRRWAAYLALDNPTLIKKRGAKSLDEALEIFQGVSVNKDSNWSQFEQVWSEDSIAAAFGEEGEPGNAAKLRRLGNVTIATWNSLLELAVHAKEGQTCSEMTEACGAHIELFNIGLWQILKMMSTTVNQAGLVLAGQTAPDGSALTFDIAMDLTPNPQLLERLTKAVKQAAKLELGLFAQHAQAGKLISARVSR